VDKYLVSLALLLLCIECGWLAEDLHLLNVPLLNKTLAGSNRNGSLGELTLVKKNVRKKSNSSLVWEDTENSSQVFAYDSVLTLDQSTAEITLNSGTSITLHENTLVSIEPPSSRDGSGPVRLKFHRGSMNAHLGRDPASVDAGDWVVEAEPKSKISVRSTGSDKFEIESHGGEVRVLNSGETQSPTMVKMGQAVVVNDQKISEIKEVLNLQWSEPKDGKRIYTHQDAIPVRFQWEGEASDISIYEPESDHGSIIPINATDGEQLVTLGTGNFAIQLMNKGLLTYSRNISIWSAPKIYLLDPLPRERIKSDKPLPLSWTLNKEVSSYVWQISTDKEFKNIIKSGETKDNTATTNDLPLGKLYWRVLGKDEAGYIIPEIYSNPFYILEKPLEAPKLKVPKIITEPENESLLFKIWNFLLPQASADDGPAPQNSKKLPKIYKAEFLWEKVEGAGSYTIEISETPDFRDSVVMTKTSSPRFVWKNFKLSEYYWRVAAESKEGDLGLFSEVAKADLTVIPLGPITPVGILAKPKPTPVPTPQPTVAPMPKPTPMPTPLPPLEPQYHPSDYSIEVGAHYLYESFKGPDFNAQETGAYVGDARLGLKSPFKGTEKWRTEVELQKVTVKPSDPVGLPFQGSASYYSFRVTALDQTPYLNTASLGLSVMDEYSFFQRSGPEDLSIQFPILVGPVLDWRHNYKNHEVHYRVGAYIGSAFGVEGTAAYTFLLPAGEGFTFTSSFEFRGSGGVMTNASVWGSGTGFFFFGARW